MSRDISAGENGGKGKRCEETETSDRFTDGTRFCLKTVRKAPFRYVSSFYKAERDKVELSPNKKINREQLTFFSAHVRLSFITHANFLRHHGLQARFTLAGKSSWIT